MKNKILRVLTVSAFFGLLIFSLLNITAFMFFDITLKEAAINYLIISVSGFALMFVSDKIYWSRV